MSEFFSGLLNNPLVVTLLASPIALIIGWSVYKALMKIVLSPKNIGDLAEAIDKFVDKVQKKDPAAGKLTRAKIIIACEDIIEKLKAADGCN